VALAGTDIPLLVRPEESPLPTLDSTRLLARAALREALTESRVATPAEAAAPARRARRAGAGVRDPQRSRRSLARRIDRASLLGYTNGMKTAVSVPDAIFERAEKLARRMRKSRSQLYSDALRDYAARHDPATVTAALDALYEGEDSGPDAFVRESARRTLRSTDW
jgi:predicted transcriptional regulator